jgi:TolB-like protein
MERSGGQVCYDFGDFRLDASRRTIVSRPSNARLPLAPKVFDLALYFVTRPRELLPKSRLLDDLWPGLVVEENSLPQVVSMLRQALGEKPGENRYIVTVPRRGYRFVADVVQVLDGAQTSTALDLAIAVLPFDSLGKMPGDDLLAMGLPAGILHHLAETRGLKLVAQSSSVAFRSARTDARAIGRRLGAHYLLTGSVQRAGTRLRITAQLIDASDGTYVWSLMFDHMGQDVFAIEDEVSQCVADRLRSTLLVSRCPPLPDDLAGTLHQSLA